MYDLLIKNGKLVTPELVQEGNVAVGYVTTNS